MAYKVLNKRVIKVNIFRVVFCYVFSQNICCGYSLEALLMINHHINAQTTIHVVGIIRSVSRT